MLAGLTLTTWHFAFMMEITSNFIGAYALYSLPLLRAFSFLPKYVRLLDFRFDYVEISAIRIYYYANTCLGQ